LSTTSQDKGTPPWTTAAQVDDCKPIIIVLGPLIWQLDGLAKTTQDYHCQIDEFFFLSNC